MIGQEWNLGELVAKSNGLMVIDGHKITKTDVMQDIDHKIQNLYKTGDMQPAINTINNINELDKVVGKAKAKMYHGWCRWYKDTGQEEKRNDTFEDMVVSETSTTSTTLKRYINVWEQIENCNIPVEVQDRRMDDLIKIASALSQGYEIGKEEWKKLARATNSSEVREILHEVKGTKPRKSGLDGIVDRQGSIWVYQSGEKYFVGSLNLSDPTPAVQKMIRRIIDNAGLKEK